ncbi:MAG: hypothetical protein KKE23_02260 [Nanoarchaeota archaeon]|nr:hypothetical protein [Nanoarchaeota archaeon]
MEELETKTRQVWEESKKQIEEFEKEKATLDKKYEGDVKALGELVENSKKAYMEKINSELDSVKEKLLSKHDKECISGLEGRLTGIVTTMDAELMLSKDKNETSKTYLKAVNGAFEAKSFALSSCFDKWFKDYASINEGDTVNWEKVEKKKEILEGYKSKAIRKERKRNAALDESIKETEIKLRTEIAEAYQKSKGFSDRTKYPLSFPILINEVSNGSENKIDVIFPLNSCSMENGSMQKILNQSLEGFEATQLENALMKYSIKATFNGETVARLKSNLEESIRKSDIHLEPRIYLAYAEMNAETPEEVLQSVNIPQESYDSPLITSQEKIESGPIVKKEPIGKKEYSVKETAKLLGTHYSTIWRRVHESNDENFKKLLIWKDGAPLISEEAVNYLKGCVKTIKQKSNDQNTTPEDKPSEEVKRKRYTMKEAGALLGMDKVALCTFIHSKNVDQSLGDMIITEPMGKRKRVYLPQEGLDYLAKLRGITFSRSDAENLQENNLFSNLSKKEIVSLGVEYLKAHYHKHGTVPTARSWSSKNIGDSWKNYWKTFNGFFKSMMRSQKGKEVRRSLEEELAFGGLSGVDIAKRLKMEIYTVGRDLKELGIITSSEIKRSYNTVESIKNKKMNDFKDYPKDEMREKMLGEAIDSLPRPEKLNYLGLEGPHFGSYIFLSQLLKIDPKKSLIAEKDSRAYNAMKSIITSNQKIKGGEIFNGLNLYSGQIDNALNCTAYKNLKFDFINLDYNGYLSKNNLETVRSLFKNNQIANDAVLFVTLDESPRAQGIVRNGGMSLAEENSNGFLEQYGTEDQGEILTKIVSNLADENKYSIQTKLNKPYVSRETPMRLMSFKLGRKE